LLLSIQVRAGGFAELDEAPFRRLRLVSYSIRPWGEDDRDQVVRLITGVQEREFGLEITVDDQPDIVDVEALYRAGGGEFWVAKDPGVVIGTIAAIDIGDRMIALRELFVAAEHRGPPRALAVGLLEVLVAWAEQRSIRDIFLGTTSVMHAAHRFYERHGFGEIERMELPVSFPVMLVDSRFYRRSLSGMPDRVCQGCQTE
jgi:N-acetylglutamate synthase-like GNAT family acetyltransferase